MTACHAHSQSAAHRRGGSRILLISASLRLWTIQSQQKAHLPIDLMNKPALEHTEQKKKKNACEEANPCTHGTRENTNKYTPSFRDHTLHNITYKYNYNCCCYSGSWRLCGGLEACCWSWAKLWGKHWCPREAMLTESRQCGSTLTQSPHTHIHTNTHSLKRMSNRHLALGMPWDITDKIGAYCSSEWHGQTILLHTAQQSHFKWSTSVGGSAL